MKPMLAGTCLDVDKLNYPVLVSPKLDGIRALVVNGALVSRNLKPIRNIELQERYGRPAFEGLDGELVTGAPTHRNCFLRTTSVVMSRDKPALETQFMVFDAECTTFENWRPFTERLGLIPDTVAKVEHTLAYSVNHLTALEEDYLQQGYEGLMIRAPGGPYKHGRGTVAEGWLLKLKRFHDAEAQVVGYEELMHNGNDATVDALGYTKRSTHAANMKGRGMLGAFKVLGCNGPYAGTQFSIGTGLTEAQRMELWVTRAKLPGLTVKYRYFPLGSKDAPRFPVFLGFRGDL